MKGYFLSTMDFDSKDLADIDATITQIDEELILFRRRVIAKLASQALEATLHEKAWWNRFLHYCQTGE